MGAPILARAICISVLLPIVWSQDSVQRPTPKAAKAAFTRLVDVAHGLPAEFAADALIRLSRTHFAESKGDRIALLEDAFQFARQAQYPTPRRLAAGGPRDAGSDSHLAVSLRLGLDILSLRASVVREMLSIQPRRAEDMLESLSVPDFPKSTCQDTTAPDVSGFYRFLTVAADTLYPFDPKDRNAVILERFVARTPSPAHVGPTAKMLASVKLTAPQLAMLSSLFANSLQSSKHDPSALLHGDTTVTSLTDLAIALQRNKLENNSLLKAARDYAIYQLSGKRCLDTSGDSATAEAIFLADLNSLFASRASPPEGRPGAIGRDEIQRDSTPAPTGSRTRIAFWRSQPSRGLLEAVQRLVTLSQDKLLSKESGLSSYRQVLEETDEWTAAAGESPGDYFRQKASLYEGLLRIAPNSDLRDRVIQSYLQLLKQESLLESRIEWFSYGARLLKQIEADRETERRFEPQLSGIPVLSFYHELREIAPDQASFTSQ